MRQKYRTTCFADEPLHYEKSFEDHPHRRGDVVGFRLVHDSQHNISRGGMWSYDREWSAGAYQFNNGWTNSHAALGFRLVVNGRKE